MIVDRPWLLDWVMDTKNVVYKDIPGFYSKFGILKYKVGDDGSFWEHSPTEGNPHWWEYMDPKYNSKGYRVVSLSDSTHRRVTQGHTVILEVFVGPCPPGMVCCHADGIRCNNELSNLRWATRLANRKDSVRLKEGGVGKRHWKAKLTEKEVREIKLELLEGKPQSQISRERGIKYMTIHLIAKGKSWKHVTLKKFT